MFPDHPSITAANSALEPDRIERPGRVCAYAIAGHGTGNLEQAC